MNALSLHTSNLFGHRRWIQVITIISVVLLATTFHGEKAYSRLNDNLNTDTTGLFHGDTLKIMPLGDSITELDWEGGYRSYMYKILNDSGLVFDFIGTKNNNHDDNSLGFIFPQPYWDHEGYGSATITSNSGSTWIWNQNIDVKLTANPPDFVLILLGTNDLNNGCCSASDVRDHMSALLDQVWAFDPYITIILGSPPSVRPSSLDDRIAAYDSLLPGLVSEKKALGREIRFADHHAIMNTTDDLVGDGIHPSPQGYKKMAQVWADAIMLNPVTAAEDEIDVIPKTYALLQNYPNPFNPTTRIHYTLPERAGIRLQIFDILGQVVASLVNGEQGPGDRFVEWDASAFSGGVYFYVLTGDRFTTMKKMLLIR